MGKPTGFLEIERRENPFRREELRVRDFDDLHAHLPEAERLRQAARCMNCGVPFCQSDYGCPLHNLIPEWNDLLYRKDLRGALGRLLKTAPFPEFTGRVCPALCEKACMMADTDGATVNRDNELYLVEEGFRRGWIQPRVPRRRTGKTVAVVGSGPSGLAAADRLNQLGHAVTVFERADRPGGLLMYGIPNMKLPKDVVLRRIRLMEAEGVSFRTGTPANPETVRDFDAVVLCGGARAPRPLRVPGEDAKGVRFAVEYLTEATRALLERRPSTISAKGKNVVVVGGGDTGNDCVGTCLRQGCKTLIELEMLPAAPSVRPAGNPWPEWPRVLRTDYGQLEAAQLIGHDPRVFETTVLKVIPDERGTIAAIQTARTARGADGRFAPVEGTEKIIPCELLLIAAGFIGGDPATVADFSVGLTPRGVPEAAQRSHRLGGNLFAAGDMRTGQSLVVRAIADGRAAAEEIHQWLAQG